MSRNVSILETFLILLINTSIMHGEVIKMKKRRINSEILYLIAILVLSFSIDLLTIANMGLSAINGPAYILSEKVYSLTYGQAEYIVEGIIFIIFCILMKKFKMAYLSSFITGVLYATMADIWKIIIPFFQTRIVYFFIGFILSAMAVAMFYKSYLYPQIYDFFVQEISKKYHITLKIFKTCFDCTFLILSFIMSLFLFHGIVGIGIGTIIVALFNGTFISFFKNFLDKHFICIPKFTKLEKYLKL